VFYARMRLCVCAWPREFITTAFPPVQGFSTV
jgi:hypothetical protein